MKSLTTALRTGLLLLSAVFFSGCGGQAEPLLRVGTNVWPGYETLYLARSRGLLDEDLVRLVELPSTTAVMNALRNGNLEAGAMTLDEALTLAAEGMRLRVVLVMDISDGADMLLARRDITDLSALRGRRVGVEQTGVGAVMLDGALKAAGLAPADVQVVPLTADSHEAAFRFGRVDAVVTFEPVSTRLLGQGAHLLFDSSKIPGRIVDVLAVRDEVVSRHGMGLEQLLHAYIRALAFLRDHPVEAAQLMAPRTGLAPEDLLQAYTGLDIPNLREIRHLLTGNPPPLQRTASHLAGLMRKSDLIGSGDTEATLLFDPHWLLENTP